MLALHHYIIRTGIAGGHPKECFCRCIVSIVVVVEPQTSCPRLSNGKNPSLNLRLPLPAPGTDADLKPPQPAQDQAEKCQCKGQAQPDLQGEGHGSHLSFLFAINS